MKTFQIVGLVLIIFALIGFISQTGPFWARVVLLVLGVGSFALDILFKKK